MTITVTPVYDDTHGRVLITATNLPAIATSALFEWSNDNIHWRNVRGGANVVITAGTATLYDYEYTDSILNYYRVSAVSTNTPSFLAVGTAATANNGSVTPALPAGQGATWGEGDTLGIWCSIRNSGVGVTVCPTGYSVALQIDNIALFTKRATVSETAPTVTVTGGVTGADVIAQIAVFRNVEHMPVTRTSQKNPSAANIAYPPVAGFQNNWAITLYLGWRQSSWTVPGVGTLTGATEIAEAVSALGSGAGQVWDYRVQTTPAPITVGAFVVSSGTAAISYGSVAVLGHAPYVMRTVASVRPVQGPVWLKVPTVPYLNRTITLIDWDEFSRASRANPYTVVGRIAAGAVTDYCSPRSVNINVWTTGDTDTASLDLVLSTGNVMFLHVPATCILQSFYATLGNYKYIRSAHRSHNHTYTIPLTEVLMPDVSISGNSVTWATLLTLYGTWQDVLTNNASWSAVLSLQGQPADSLISH